MKFTRFLEDEIKAPTAIDARKLFAPKVYHTKREVKIYRLALVITISIIILALAVALIGSSFSIINRQVDKAVEEPVYMDPTPDEESDIIPAYETKPICSSTSTFKSWMDYRKITNTSTRQWRYQQIATTDEYGFRLVDGYYMVAMAKQYGPVGTKYLITFSGGQQMRAIIGDVKGNTSCTHPDGSMIEMIVDSEKMPGNVKRSGNYNSMISGSITEIRIINNEEKENS